MKRAFIVLLVLVFANPLFATDSSSPFTKTWTHVNGNSATLEVLKCDGETVTFLKPDGYHWTIPLKQLKKEDRSIAIQLSDLRTQQFRVSSHLQDDELNGVRAKFAALQNDNPELFSRLNQLAEKPINDYSINVNDGVYNLQFSLKPGMEVDKAIEGDLVEYLSLIHI